MVVVSATAQIPVQCLMAKDNKILSVKGNPDHPMTRGDYVKVKNYEERGITIPTGFFYPHTKELEKKGKEI